MCYRSEHATAGHALTGLVRSRCLVDVLRDVGPSKVKVKVKVKEGFISATPTDARRQTNLSRCQRLSLLLAPCWASGAEPPMVVRVVTGIARTGSVRSEGASERVMKEAFAHCRPDETRGQDERHSSSRRGQESQTHTAHGQSRGKRPNSPARNRRSRCRRGEPAATHVQIRVTENLSLTKMTRPAHMPQELNPHIRHRDRPH